MRPYVSISDLVVLFLLLSFFFFVDFLFGFCEQCLGSRGGGMRCDAMVVDGFSSPSHVGPVKREMGVIMYVSGVYGVDKK